MGYNACMAAPIFPDLRKRLQLALEARVEFCSQHPGSAWRLFNGFYEGFPDLVVDYYAGTLLLFDYSLLPLEQPELLDQVQAFYLQQLPELQAVICKQRHSPEPARRRGWLSWGGQPARQLREHGVWYALDLQLQQDASFYLDTRGLRAWLLEKAAGWQVLNTFAYTGSLGVAALAGGAQRVIQGDRSRNFLALARQSAMLNHLDLGRMSSQALDFFTQVARLKRDGQLFDCVILDPPFFSSTAQGTVDLVNESQRLINKVRPLVADGGFLVAINNALFLSGGDYYAGLETLCQDGYLEIDQLVAVPADITGYPQTVVSRPPADPAPFNHATKIAVLRVRRK